MKHQIEVWAKASGPLSELAYKCVACGKLWDPQESPDYAEECPRDKDSD